MKTLQINVWQGRLLKPLLKLIADEAPDVIFAQEIYSYPEPISLDSPWNYLGTVELIAKQNGFEHIYFSPSNIFPMFGHDLGYGNAIFSKFKPSQASTHYTGGTGPSRVDSPESFDGNVGRNFQHLTVSDGSRDINLINHHAHWVNQQHGNEVSTSRLQLVANYVKTLSGPIIVAGDFNVVPASPAMVAFEKSVDLKNLTVTTGAKSTLSAAHFMQQIVCDYILTSPNLEVKHIDVLDRLVSDHRAILAEIN